MKLTMVPFKLDQDSSYPALLMTCLAGVYFHVFLDSFLYKDMRPSFPVEANPFLGRVSVDAMYLFCTISFLIGGLIYLWRRNKSTIGIIFTIIIMFLALCTLGLSSLSWSKSPFNDGPFYGVDYEQTIVAEPNSSVELGSGYEVGAYNRALETPVIALRDKNGKVLWSKLLVTANVKRYVNTSVQELTLTRARKTPNGYHIQGRVRWTFGAEAAKAANFYLDKHRNLKKFYLSW